MIAAQKHRPALKPRLWLTPSVLSAVALAVLVAATFLPLLLGIDALHVDPVNRLKPPSAAHWLGTDHLGRDLLWLSLDGGRISVSIGVSVASLALCAGTLLGLLTVASR